jgi:hypothetical protein
MWSRVFWPVCVETRKLEYLFALAGFTYGDAYVIRPGKI